MRGRFTADGEPVAHGEVALLRDGEVVQLAFSDTDGAFELADAGDALVGRALGDVVGIAVGAPGADLDAAGPWHELTIEVTSPDGVEHPARLSGFLDPVELAALDGLDRDAALRATGPQSARSHFAALALPEPRTALRVQAGRWRVGASFVIHERGDMVEPDFENVVAARATADGTDLQGGEWTGFELTLDQPLTVTLQLRVLDDAEL